jgi:hypothetical protein
LYGLDRFDVLMSKMIFKKMKKHHWHAFWHEKLFEKHPQAATTLPNMLLIILNHFDL